MQTVVRIWRRIEVMEDADIPCELSVPTDEYEDTMDAKHRAPRHRTWPEWSCECGQRNRGRDLACCWCGETRDDLDQCK